MGGRNGASEGCLSCTRREAQYLTYKRGSRQIYNPEILDAMIPTKEEGLQGNILLDMGKWKKYQMEHICPLISEWNVRQGLWLGWNHETEIIVEIVGIRFQFMRSLSLDRNAIYSIELIAEIWMPNLIQLNLQHNNIVYMKSLTKMPQVLQKLQINNNPLLDTRQNLYRVRSQNMKGLYFGSMFSDLVKMNLRSAQKIWAKRKVKNWEGSKMQKISMKRRPPIVVIPAVD